MAIPSEPIASPTSIRCRGVTKTYGTGNAAVQALRGINLEVHTGELLVLAGPSGCGKTTLISVLAGLLQRDAGECSVLDRDYEKMDRHETTRFRGENIGFVFQSFDLIPTLTATENAAIPLLIGGGQRRPALEKTRAMLKTVGFDDRMTNSLPAKLSGGQQQRVAIARALVHHPKLIVCDEPTSALDSQSGKMVMQLMREFARGQDRALVVVTHDDRIFEFADRIAWMEDGRITRVETAPAGARATAPKSPEIS